MIFLIFWFYPMLIPTASQLWFHHKTEIGANWFAIQVEKPKLFELKHRTLNIWTLCCGKTWKGPVTREQQTFEFVLGSHRLLVTLEIEPDVQIPAFLNNECWDFELFCQVQRGSACTQNDQDFSPDHSGGVRAVCDSGKWPPTPWSMRHFSMIFWDTPDDVVGVV